ncbi:TerD family protein [Streptomyces sp. NPDC087440]|uniref:TerD family protein n=1 Tax=Streptomyces sp. NPDC087440 TaxID=3365790 RepID=UPI00382D8F93
MTFTPPSPLDTRMPSLPEYAREWALVDVETSGLVARRDRVLSIAVITLDAAGRQTGEFTTLLDPGCDPGPVEVHGLTPERLRGAPRFGEVAGRIGALLQDRVMVAHNAQFDYDFLAHEFARARLWLPVAQRLCTLSLNRQLDPPTDDLKLGTLAAHYGVPQQRAHDALDDTRVLTGILRASLAQAAALDLPLPLVACPPRQDTAFAPQPPKTPCAYRNPGRMGQGGPLVQGMKVAVTGETATARAELVARAVAAGLNVMTSVSGHTSALVTNDTASGSAKARRALAEGVPVIDESTFLRLLGDVREGTRHGADGARAGGGAAAPAWAAAAPSPVAPAPQAWSTARPGEPAPAWESGPAGGGVDSVREEGGSVREEALPGSDGAPAPAAPGLVPSQAQGSGPARPARAPRPVGPLAGRRVLVLGGTHPEAAACRTRVVELGGSAAVNLSASVTDVVVLAGGEKDRRMKRIETLAVPTHAQEWLDGPIPAYAPGSASRPAAPLIMPRGGVMDLPALRAGTPLAVTATWGSRTVCEIDVVAFVLDDDEQVSFDEDFVFFGAPENPAGTVRLLTDGPTEQTVAADLAALPPSAHRVVVAAAVDGEATFGDVGPLQIAASLGGGEATLARATLDAATTERTLLLGEFYRRAGAWRFRAVGQGYDHGLGELARGYGVDVAA